MKNRNVISIMTVLIAVISIVVATTSLQERQAEAARSGSSSSSSSSERTGGTIALSGNNVYVAWWNNKTGDFEVMFRASADNGHTFGPKINLSNSPGVISNDAQIVAEGKNVYVIWWEGKTTTTRDPVLRISYDGGKTFGEKIMLSNVNAITAAGTALSK